MLEQSALLQQRCQLLAQRGGLGFHHAQLAAGLLAPLFGCCEFALAALKSFAPLTQAPLKLIELKQAGAQPIAHQQHQAERDGADQAAGEHRDHHGRAARPHPEQAEAGLAHLGTEPIAEGGEHSTQQQQRQDQQPARHNLARRRSVSVGSVQLNRLASASGSNTVIFLRSICTRPALRRSPSRRVMVTRVEPIASAIA